MKNYYISNIKWDTTDSVEEIDEIILPSELLIEAEDEDSIADALSDKHGFCVESFDYAPLNITTLRKLIKNKKLYFDFTADADDDKKWLEEHGDTYDIEYSYNLVEEMTQIGDDTDMRTEFPRKRYDGSYILNAPDVDYLLFKGTKFKITGDNTFTIKDIGYYDGCDRIMAIR